MKILVVEDTAENMAVAKAFFFTIPEHEFIFCTNRKEAEEILPAVDGMISDRSIPFNDDESQECNGISLMFQASLLQITAVGVSNHGDTNYWVDFNEASCEKNKGYLKVDREHSEEFNKLDFSNSLSLLKGFDHYSPRLNETSLEALLMSCYSLEKFYCNEGKKNPKLWEMAFRRLMSRVK